jgi:class 3 adenylate cyclase
MARTENLTIMFTDIVGYSELTATLSRDAMRLLLREHDRILLPTCRAFGGRRVKAIGDALLLSFRSPTDAVRCAMAMQNAVARARSLRPELQALHVRVAINVGEVRIESRDVFGEAVNVAARLEALTPPDAIWFTEAVYLAMNKAEAPSQSLGSRELRGIPEPVRVYCVPSHPAQRLIPAGAPPTAAEQDLPFPHVNVALRPFDAAVVSVSRGLAAAQHRLAPVWRAGIAALARTSAPVRWGVAAFAGVAIVLSLTLHAPTKPLDASPKVAPSSTSAVLKQGELLLERKELDALSELIAQRLKADPRDAEALLLRGHLAFAQKRRLIGVAEYSRALALNPGLQDNARLAANLVDLLDSEPSAVKPLLLQYQGETLLQALAQRSGQPGYAGRAQAAQLLRELGQSRRIDRFNYAVQELEGRSECEDRLAAVRELRALKDPRAIPHLEKVTSGGLAGWFRQSCLREEALATLKELRARGKS